MRTICIAAESGFFTCMFQQVAYIAILFAIITALWLGFIWWITRK